MHISSVRALWPAVTVRSALSPMLLYVHSHVTCSDAKLKKVGASNRFMPGCSQSVLSNTIASPSLTAVVADCLCECVEIDQNWPCTASHVALTTKSVACGGIAMSLL